MDVTGAWEYLIKTYDVPPMASQVMDLVAWWADFQIDHIGFDEMTITNAMTALQLHNSKIPLDQRYTPGQVAQRLMLAVGKASRQLLNECNNEIDAAPDKWTYKIATTDPTTGVVTYVRNLFGIVAWLNRLWGNKPQGRPHWPPRGRQAPQEPSGGAGGNGGAARRACASQLRWSWRSGQCGSRWPLDLDGKSAHDIRPLRQLLPRGSSSRCLPLARDQAIARRAQEACRRDPRQEEGAAAQVCQSRSRRW